MRKYRWALLKGLEYLNSRMPDFEVRPAFIHQLAAYENRLIACGLGPKTSDWTEVFDRNSNEFENEELMLTNTYLNSQIGPFIELPTCNASDKKRKLRWADDYNGNLATTIEEPIRRHSTTPLVKNKHKRINSDRNHLNNIPQKITITTHKAESAKRVPKMKENISLETSKTITKSQSEKCMDRVNAMSPEIAELIEYFPAKAQIIPKLNPTLTLFHSRKNIAAKKLSVPTSNFTIIRKGVADMEKAKSYLKMERRDKRKESPGISQFRVRVGIKAEPVKGEPSEQIYISEKVVKKRHGTPAVYLKKENINNKNATKSKYTNPNKSKTTERIRIKAKPQLRKSDSEPIIPRRFSASKYSMKLSLIHICRCRRSTLCRSRWSPYH
eukprot:TRINITY_DN2758_c0_g3_i1.p1 TRINITY_DN2758_c0_g3~~TRINITY_DN2758_c0_g3_i1.p1  ORF type:complete len:384 (-),score=74.84 TRINITY_DN2758_c0_g3_i1:20-1171(-)